MQTTIRKFIVSKVSEVSHISPKLGEQGWRSGESARLPPIGPEFDSGPVPYLGWVCCWFSPFSEGFSPGFPVFLPPQNQHSNFQFDQDRGPAWKLAKVDGASSLNIVISFFLSFFIYLFIYSYPKKKEPHLRIVRPFKDHKFVNAVRRQLADLGQKINADITPVHTCRKIKHEF